MFLKFKTNHRKTLNGRTGIHGIRRRYKTQLWKLAITKPFPYSYIATELIYGVRPLREFFIGKNIFGNLKLFPYTNNIFPGFIVKSINDIYVTKKLFSMQIVPMFLVPLNSIISFIFNKNNTKMTFSKSSGCNAFRRKDIKKSKLLYIQLSSKKLIVLPLQTFCVLGPNLNLHLNKIIEGKWGTFNKNTKKLMVRGVAKNPVDHPNGGRTKAKQPELSPWGWIAKKSK